MLESGWQDACSGLPGELIYYKDSSCYLHLKAPCIAETKLEYQTLSYKMSHEQVRDPVACRTDPFRCCMLRTGALQPSKTPQLL